MQHFKSLVLLALVFLCFPGCQQSQTLNIAFFRSNINYAGRIDFNDSRGAVLYWSGTSIKLNFEGESIEAVLEDETGDNYFNVIIDGGEPTILKPDTTRANYLLASELGPGPHSIELFKRTEWSAGKTFFSGFVIRGNARALPKDSPRKRKIEFYGNSITAGYAVEDTSGQDRPDSTFTNNYLSYAAITARHFDADYRCICKSGIGITISWFPMVMPEIYDRLDPEDSTSRWDFSKYTPDVVVVNLMQNDSWLVNMPERAEFKASFGDTAPLDADIIDAYQSFIKSIRMAYPNAAIISALGNMDATREGSKWPGLVEKAVKGLNDQNIHTHFFPFKNTGGHPSTQEQEAMSASLIQFINDRIDW